MNTMTAYLAPVIAWVTDTTTIVNNYVIETAQSSYIEAQVGISGLADKVQVFWNYVLPYLQQSMDLMRTHLGATAILSLSSVALLYSAFNSYAQESMVMAVVQTALAVLAIGTSGWLLGAYGMQNYVRIL